LHVAEGSAGSKTQATVDIVGLCQQDIGGGCIFSQGQYACCSSGLRENAGLREIAVRTEIQVARPDRGGAQDQSAAIGQGHGVIAGIIQGHSAQELIAAVGQEDGIGTRIQAGCAADAETTRLANAGAGGRGQDGQIRADSRGGKIHGGGVCEGCRRAAAQSDCARQTVAAAVIGEINRGAGG